MGDGGLQQCIRSPQAPAGGPCACAAARAPLHDKHEPEACVVDRQRVLCALAQRGLRLNRKNPELWIAYFRFELVFLAKVQKR